MRRSVLVAGVGMLVVWSVAVRRPVAAAAASPCVTATAGCTEWVTLGGGPARSMIYRTYSLAARNDGIRRALVMVHGTNRNADHYFSTATSAAFLAGALDDTVVIAPLTPEFVTSGSTMNQAAATRTGPFFVFTTVFTPVHNLPAAYTT